jgi:hypothetical protein
MEQSSQFEPRHVLPGLALRARKVEVRIRDVPALAQIIGEPRYEFSEECQLLNTTRTIYIASNSDQTFELINKWPGFRLDAGGSPAIFADAVEIDRESNPARSIELLRTHTMQIDPNRIELPNSKLLELIKEGAFDDIAQLFIHDRSLDLRAYGAMCLMLGEHRLSHTTFYRHMKDEENKSDEPRPDQSNNQQPRLETSTPDEAQDNQPANDRDMNSLGQQPKDLDDDPQKDLFSDNS